MIHAPEPGEVGRRSPAEVAAIKQARAAQLARAPSRADAAGPGRRALLLQVGRERYALPVEAIEGVHPPGPVTPIPGTPVHVRGVTCVLGEALTLLDLERLLGALPAAEAGPGQVVVVRAGPHVVALRVERVEALRTLTDLQPFTRSRAGGAWLQPEQVLGVAEGDVLLVDIEQVLTDPRLAVGAGAGPDPRGHP